MDVKRVFALGHWQHLKPPGRHEREIAREGTANRLKGTKRESGKREVVFVADADARGVADADAGVFFFFFYFLFRHH